MSLRLELQDLQGGFLEVVRAVRQEGRRVSPRGLDTREVVDATLVFTNTSNMIPVGTGAGVSVKIAAANAAQLIGGVHYPSILSRILSSYESFDSDGVDREGYGPRAHAQVWGAVRRLAADSSSRAAIVTLQPPSSEAADGGRVFPCTTSIQFLLREGALDMVVSMRSNDVLRGLSTDAWTFTRLQRTIAWVLGVQPGSYYHHAASLHVYDRDSERLDSLHAPDRPPLLVEGFAPAARRSDSRARHELRLTRAQNWARGALGVGDGGPATRPDNVGWYYDQLRPFWLVSGAPMMCWSCRKIRDVAMGSSNGRRGRSTRCGDCTRAVEQRRPRNTPEGRHATNIASHGLTQEAYDAMVEAQGGRCASCGDVPSTGRWGLELTIDHDHGHCPGKKGCAECVSGLLCNRCNPMLGFAGDDPAVLEAGAAYLRRVRSS